MKKVIIIGATSGIGKELAKIFSNNGYEVGITGRRTNLLVIEIPALIIIISTSPIFLINFSRDSIAVSAVLISIVSA